MKKIHYLKLVFLLACSTISARDLYLQARGAYFYPTDSKFRKSFSGAGIYGLQFDCQLYKPLFCWLETDYYTQNGHTQGDHDRTRVDIIRNSLGMKYVYNRHFIKPYIGLGLGVSWLHTHVDSSFLIRSLSKWGVGPLVKAGAFIMLSRSFFIDVFTDYSWQTMNMKKKSHKKVIFPQVDISGFSFGTGIGYRF